MDYRQEARRIASEFGIDPDLFVNLVQAESSFIPDNISEDGAGGLTQIMPNTALKPGYNVFFFLMKHILVIQKSKDVSKLLEISSMILSILNCPDLYSFMRPK